jgi:hypothetical protein
MTYPSTQEFATLQRVAAKIHLNTYLIAFVEFAERFSYYGTTVVFTNYMFVNILASFCFLFLRSPYEHSHPVNCTMLSLSFAGVSSTMKRPERDDTSHRPGDVNNMMLFFLWPVNDHFRGVRPPGPVASKPVRSAWASKQPRELQRLSSRLPFCLRCI